MRQRLLAVLDVAAIVLSMLLCSIVLTGGFVLHVGDLLIRLRTPDRAAYWLAAVVIARVLLYRAAPPFGLTGASWKNVLIVPAGADPFRAAAAPGFWRRTAIAALALAAALALLMHEQVRDLYRVADIGDPLFSMWRMAWVQHQIVTDPLHLFDTNVFYPTRLTLALGDPMILTALLEAPLRAVGVHPVVAYNLMFLWAMWFSGVATYLLVERLTGSALAAFVAGLIYQCYPYRLDHLSHLELQMTQWMPLGLLALHLWLSTQRRVFVFALAAAVVAQLYSSMYYAVFFVVYAAVIGIGLLWIHRPPLRQLVPAALVAMLCASILAAPLVAAFVAAQPMKGDRELSEVQRYSAVMPDYLRSQRYSVWWTGLTTTRQAERSLFPGAAPLVLGAIGLAPPFSAIRAVYAAGLLVSLDASRGLNGVVYPPLYRWFPPIRGMRVASRFSIVVGLTLAIFSGFGARRLMRLGRGRAGAVFICAVLSAGVLVDGWSKIEGLVPIWKTPPTIYQHVKNDPTVVLAELPAVTLPYLNAPWMYFSLWHWRTMVNGFSGFEASSYPQILPALLEFPRGDTPDRLRRRGVTHVTINCGIRITSCEETARLMAESSDLRLIAEESWEGEPVRLYELLKP